MIKTTSYVIQRDKVRIEVIHHHGADNVTLMATDGLGETKLLMPPSVFHEVAAAFGEIWHNCTTKPEVANAEA